MQLAGFRDRNAKCTVCQICHIYMRFCSNSFMKYIVDLFLFSKQYGPNDKSFHFKCTA